MPWDGTELRIVDLAGGRAVGEVRTLLGGPEESVLQPEWVGVDELHVVSDRSGWWNMYRIGSDGADPVALCPMDADIGGPLWMLGARWHTRREDGTLLTVRTFGTDTLAVLDPDTGS